MLVLVQEKKIVGTYVDSMEFSYKDITTSTTPDALKGYKEREKGYVKTEENMRQIVFIDTLGDNTAEGILVIDNKVYSTLDVTGRETTLERISFEVTNSFRAKNGLYELEWCEEAAEAARKHSEDMKNNNFFAHESFDGTKFSDRINLAGISWWSCAENIAAGYSEGFHATYGWINSSGHRRNILSDSVERLGVGIVKGGSYGMYYTQDFYTPR